MARSPPSYRQGIAQNLGKDFEVEIKATQDDGGNGFLMSNKEKKEAEKRKLQYVVVQLVNVRAEIGWNVKSEELCSILASCRRRTKFALKGTLGECSANNGQKNPKRRGTVLPS